MFFNFFCFSVGLSVITNKTPSHSHHVVVKVFPHFTFLFWLSKHWFSFPTQNAREIWSSKYFSRSITSAESFPFLSGLKPCICFHEFKLNWKIYSMKVSRRWTLSTGSDEKICHQFCFLCLLACLAIHFHRGKSKHLFLEQILSRGFIGNYVCKLRSRHCACVNKCGDNHRNAYRIFMSIRSFKREI